MLLTTTLSGVAAWALSALQLGAAPMPPVRRIIVHDEVIWRIPVAPPRATPLRWVEHKGPKCVPTRTLAGAVVSGPGQVDFLLRDRSRLRAKLDHDCPALDFYGGFYVGSDDERLCARRDEIASRMGGSCRIAKFRSLRPSAR